VGPALRFLTPRFALLALLVFPQSVFALLNIDGTRNQVFVFGELGLSYDSNIFAQNPDLVPQTGGYGDFISTFTLGTEYKRGAGTLSIDARAQVGYERFDKHPDRDAWNPAFRLELDRTTGRMTGNLILSATHSTQADSAINIRTSTWDYPVDLNLRYPINDKFYVTSDTGYLHRTYADATTLGLSDLTEYSESVDVFRVYTSKLDLLAGYRVRFSDSTAGRTTDHNFSVGATGGLLPKLNGLVQFGYQFRNVGATTLTPIAETFGNFSALGQLTWNATRKFIMVGRLSRDFSTSANTISIDSLAANLHANYILTRRYEIDGGIGYGRNHFLNQSERGRQDEFFTCDAGITYTTGDKFKATLSLVHLQNWSTLDLSDFTSNGVKLTITSRF
jgi:hypothetical protein